MQGAGPGFTQRHVGTQARRMLDAGCEPEFVVAYLAQRGVEVGAARGTVHAIVDERAAQARTRLLRGRAILHHGVGVVVFCLGAAAYWSARVPGSTHAGPSALLVVAVVGYVVAWHGLARWLGAGRAARREVRRERQILRPVDL